MAKKRVEWGKMRVEWGSRRGLLAGPNREI
jgi:hypothetical protein